MKYAIFGATGSVGKALAAEFAKKGSNFRVVGRSDETLRRHFRVYEPLVEYCEADLADPLAAARAAAGVNTIFYTVGVPYTQFQIHPKLIKIALEAATAAHVSRFIHVSTVYPTAFLKRNLSTNPIREIRSPSKARCAKNRKTWFWRLIHAPECVPQFYVPQISTDRTRN